MYTVQQFDLLAALDRHRHFGRAAHALGMSQPSLTKNLRALEDRLGYAVFDRGPPIAPTPLGAIILQRTARMRQRFADLTREIDLAKGVGGGRLTIRSGGMVAQIAVYQAIGRFSRRFPMIAVDIDVIGREAVLTAVRTGACDVAFADLSHVEIGPDLDVESFSRRPFVGFCAAGHPLAERAAVEVADMLDYPWIGTTGFAPSLPAGIALDGPMPFGWIDRKTGLVRTRLRAHTFPSLRAIVLASDAIAACPRVLIEDDLRQGLLHLLPSAYPGTVHTYQMIQRRGRTPSPAAQAFIAELRAVEARVGIGAAQ